MKPRKLRVGKQQSCVLFRALSWEILLRFMSQFEHFVVYARKKADSAFDCASFDLNRGGCVAYDF